MDAVKLSRVNQLFFGDNLQVLRDHIATESVDLIYLDPPFNSKRDYNLLFKSPKGHESEAQRAWDEGGFSCSPFCINTTDRAL